MHENEDIRPIIAPMTRTHDYGLIIGPTLAIGVYLALGSSTGISEEATRLAGITVLMATWWVTEAIPLSATALLPIVCFPLLNILPIEETTARYAHKLIFLFMGGLMLGKGLERWGAHKRLALLIILLVGTEPRRIIAGIMLSAAILSAFVSNTATAMMMLPIVLSISVLAAGDNYESKEAKRFSVCLLLALAYGASIGGIATLTGTPPNGFLAAYLTQEMGIDMSYARWLWMGVPLSAIMLPVSWAYLVFIAMPVKIGEIPGGRTYIRERYDALGTMSSGEKISILIFGFTAFMWITHGWIEDIFEINKIDDATIAIGGAILMFIMPADRTLQTRVLLWKQARDIPWGILILFGGGLALAQAVTHTGLDAWIGQQIGSMGNPGELPLLGGVTTLIVFLTEITSNTATTSTMLPVLAAVGEGMGFDPTLIIIAAAVSASCAFMLPVATPPNAIVFASGRISIKQMAMAGLGLNLICVLIITLMVWGFAPKLLNLDSPRSELPESEAVTMTLDQSNQSAITQ
ncbi:MAG: DASS family sodium-coupled anion symporter [Phycisphaerales bacterium]|nr:DASS family sodium-coupled anion symporter [Phycisphaerales bacterium]